MSNELVNLDFDSLPAAPTSSLGELKKLTKTSEYLSRIQLYTKGDAINQGKIAPGHYGIPQSDEITDLGDEIEIVLLGWRHKAMDVSDPQEIVVSYEKDSPVYEEIVDEGGLFGPSFLAFERSTGDFYELFFCNKSSRKFAGTLAPFLPISKAEAEAAGKEPRGPIPVTIGVRLAKNKKGSWHVPTVKGECEVPFNNLPPIPEIHEQLQKFYKPEDVEADERGRDR